jgi:hypothetical protein
MIHRLLVWLGIRRRSGVFVRLVYAEGPPKMLGPMSRDGAELLVILELAPTGSFAGRRVLSAQIVGQP